MSLLSAVSMVGCRGEPKGSPATRPTSAPTSRARGPAKLVLEKQLVDMGPMAPGSEIDVSVGVRNRGGERLIIRKVETGCKCVLAGVEPEVIEAGEEAKLALKVRTLNHRGPYRTDIAIASNDPRGVSRLTLCFDVPEALAAEPERVCFGVVRLGQQLARTLKVVCNRDVTSKVLYAVANNRSLVGRVIQPEVRPDKAAELGVTLTAPARPGTHRYALTVTTASKDVPAIRVPVVVSVSNAATVEPEAIDFGRIAKGARVTRELRVTVRPGTRLESVTAKPAVVDAAAAPVSSDGVSSIAVKPNGSIPFGPVCGEIVLKLVGDETSVLTIPFRAYVTESADPRRAAARGP